MTNRLAWAYLALAGLCEVVGVVGLRQVARRPTWPNYLLLYGGFATSFRLLVEAMAQIPVSIAYPVWTGIGTVGATIVGIVRWGEPATPFRILCILGIAACASALRWLS